MKQYIDKSALVAEINRRLEAISNSSNENKRELAAIRGAQQYELINLALFIDTLEVEDVDLESENENTKPKITVGTKIRLKTNPDVILSIISDDCHGDEFECSDGSVLSLNQIEKYYDICIEEK